jgi:hypothetical protein
MELKSFVIFVLTAIGFHWLMRWLFLDASFIASLLAACGTIVAASLYVAYSNNKLLEELEGQLKIHRDEAGKIIVSAERLVKEQKDLIDGKSDK